MSFNLRQFIPTRRWCLRVLIGLLLLVGGFVFSRWLWWEYTRAQGEKELATAIAETEASDPRWRWEQIEEDRPKIPDEENSILVLKQFDESLPLNKPNQPGKKWDPGAQKMANGESLIPEVLDNHWLDDDRLATIRRELTEHQSSVALAVSVKDYPRGRAILNVPAYVFATRLPHFDYCPKAARLLVMDCEHWLHERKTGNASERIRAILNIEAGFKGEGLIISQLARIRLRILAARRLERLLALSIPDAGDLKGMQAQMMRDEDEDLLVLALRGERALFTLFFENLDSGKITINELKEHRLGSESWDELLGWTFYKALLPDDQAFHLRTMHELIEIARLPRYEQLARFEEFSQRFRQQAAEAKKSRKRILTALMLPATDKLAEACIRDKAVRRCAIAALAAERYRMANHDWAKKLDDLCPRYLDQVPVDPFDGNPLKYATRADGVTIYSVGADGRDNDGLNLTPGGRETGADLGIRLWNVDQRGLPAVR